MFQIIFETYSKTYLYFLWQFFGGDFFFLQQLAGWGSRLLAHCCTSPGSFVWVSLLASAIQDITSTGRTGLECALQLHGGPSLLSSGSDLCTSGLWFSSCTLFIRFTTEGFVGAHACAGWDSCALEHGWCFVL